MLVLSLKPGERIQIGDHISIVVKSIRPGVVRLGIEAPKEITVLCDDAQRTAQRANKARKR